MDVLCVLFYLALIVLVSVLAVFLIDWAIKALFTTSSQSARETISEIHRAGQEAQRAMDQVSDEYLNQVINLTRR